MEDRNIGALIKRIFCAIRKSADNHMKENDLTMAQCQVLGYLRAQQPAELSQRDVERHFDLSHPTVSGILKRLEKNGFITTAVNKTDRRMKSINLTEKAGRMFCEIKKHQETLDAVILRGLSEEQIRTLYDLLSIVNRNLTEAEVGDCMPVGAKSTDIRRKTV